MNKTLKHYGILGMRWGRRRARSPSSPDYETVSSLRKKKTRELSTDELKKVANRLEAERKFRELNPDAITSGARKVNSVLSTIGKLSAAITTATATIKGVQKILDVYEKLPVKEDLWSKI